MVATPLEERMAAISLAELRRDLSVPMSHSNNNMKMTGGPETGFNYVLAEALRV